MNLFLIFFIILLFPHLHGVTIFTVDHHHLGYAKIEEAEKLAQKTFIKKGDLIFDVGANVGEWSTNALQFHKGISIYAFEPSPLCFAKLQKNMNRKIQMYQIAFYETTGLREFREYDLNFY